MSASSDCQDGLVNEPQAGPATMPNLVSQAKLNLLPAKDVRNAVRKEVENRHEEIARLKYILNIDAPINSLPPELLSMIFALSQPDLISVTHVCRRWRDIALQAPALWTHVVHTSPMGVNTFIQRSKMLPLDISLTVKERPTVATVRALVGQIHRTRSLCVAFPPSVGLQLVTQAIKSSCPMLEELSIRRCPCPIGNLPPVPPEPPQGPPMDFDGVPLLRSLTLSGMLLPYFPRGPNALTNIDLTEKFFTSPHILDLLTRSPSLERLRLRGLFDRTPALPNAQTVALPRLLSLDMQAAPVGCMRTFLQSLVLPQETNISLTTPRFLRVYPAFEEVAPAFDSGAFRFASLQGLKRLELTWVHRTLTLQAYRGSHDLHDPALRIETTVRQDAGPGERFLVNWPIEAAHLETLIICGKMYVDRDNYTVARERWAAMLASVPALKTLRVVSVNHETLSGLAQELALERAQPLCPQLETLELFDANPSAEFWGTMKDAVLARAPATGGSLRTIELFNVDCSAWGAADMALIAGAGVRIVKDLDSDQEDVADDAT